MNCSIRYKSRKLIQLLTLVVLIFAVLFCTCISFCACNKKTDKETQKYLQEQATVEAAVAACNMHEYNFKYDTAPTSAINAGLTLEDDTYGYIIATDKTDPSKGKSLIYQYSGVPYDDDPAHPYRECVIYSETPLDKLPSDVKVFVYCHSGGWISGNSHSEYRTLMPAIAKAGFVVFSIEYAFLCGLNNGANVSFDDFTPQGLYELASTLVDSKITVSFGDMMDDVDVFMNFLIDEFAPQHNITNLKIALGGYSAGGQIATLYAYHYQQNNPKVNIAFTMSLCGPVTINDKGYIYTMKQFRANPLVNALLPSLKNTIAGAVESSVPLDVTTKKGFNGLVESLNKFSSTTYINKHTIPTILCYSKCGVEEFNKYFPGENDGLVPFTVYKNFTKKLTDNRVVHTDKVVSDVNHLHIASNMNVCFWIAKNCQAYAGIYM